MAKLQLAAKMILDCEGLENAGNKEKQRIMGYSEAYSIIVL